MTHGFERLGRDGGNDVGGLYSGPNVVNKEDEYRNADKGEHYREQHREARYERTFVAASDGAQHHKAIRKDADKDPKNRLVHAVADETPQDLRCVLA